MRGNLSSFNLAGFARHRMLRIPDEIGEHDLTPINISSWCCIDLTFEGIVT